MPDESEEVTAAVGTPQAALRSTRLIWAALLAGQLSFLVVVAVLVAQAGGSPAPAGGTSSPSTGMLLFYVATGLLVFETPLLFFVRAQIYKKNWQGNVVSPQGYAAGNILFLAGLEAVSMLALVGALIDRALIPFVLPMFVAMAIQVVNFPHGKPMKPRDADLGASVHDQRPSSS